MLEADSHQNTAEERQLQIEARYLQREAFDAHDFPAAGVNRTADYLELAALRNAQRRRHLNEVPDPLNEQFGELTERERQTLEAIGINRLNQNDQSGTPKPLLMPDIIEHSHETGASPNARQSDTNTTITSSASPAPQNYRQSESIQEYMRQRSLEHNPERNRTSARSFQPRRRSSVVISNTTTLERQAIQQRSTGESSRYDRLIRASTGQGRLATSRYDYLSPQTLESVRALIRDGVLDDEALARVEASVDSASSRPTWRSRRDLDGGVGTMGIGWSPDGRHL